MSYVLEIKSVYDIKLKATSVLGYGYHSATVLGLLDYDSANLIEDVAPIHASIYSMLPSGTPIDPADLTYVKIKTSTGQIRVIAMDWIDTQPELINTRQVRIVISNLSLSKIPELQKMLQRNGFTQFTIDTISG
ncbi:MAG: hypothetical protein PHQ58_04245 [Rhodoferax sp.]|uniref:phage DNA polymerase-associated SH3 family protein n=1 Tax=Rhodoferax sp. TaxID=50421 RepID=UPI00261C025B|nr:phage DNA polymerase-associated SH3 family protein [Rhodoferax sp.]MDD2879625.1 hypothetical protein [Rhodoferax sp.]